MAKVEQKQVIVNQIKEKLNGASSILLVDYRGLTVEQDTAYNQKPDTIAPDVIVFILQCFEEDYTERLKKQRYTAKRIYDHLVSGKGFNGAELTIRKTVK